MKLSLNRIQREIYDEYMMAGNVYAECPRQSGKTRLLMVIAYNHLKSGEAVTYVSRHKAMCADFLGLMRREYKDLTYQQTLRLSHTTIIDDNLLYQDVVLLDEIWYEWLFQQPKKIVCLRTRTFPILKFTYKDLQGEIKKEIKHFKKQWSKEQFELEFNFGYKKRGKKPTKRCKAQ